MTSRLPSNLQLQLRMPGVWTQVDSGRGFAFRFQLAVVGSCHSRPPGARLGCHGRAK